MRNLRSWMNENNILLLLQFRRPGFAEGHIESAPCQLHTYCIGTLRIWKSQLVVSQILLWVSHKRIFHSCLVCQRSASDHYEACYSTAQQHEGNSAQIYQKFCTALQIIRFCHCNQVSESLYYVNLLCRYIEAPRANNMTKIFNTVRKLFIFLYIQRHACVL